jgi:hypothetical protein
VINALEDDPATVKNLPVSWWIHALGLRMIQAFPLWL